MTMALRSPISCMLLVCLLNLGCQLPNKQSILVYNVDSLALESIYGIMYHKKIPFTGKLYQLYPNHDTFRIFEFYKGKEHGTWKRFYPNNQIQELRYFNKGTKVKTMTRWWENGQTQLQCAFQHGVYEGPLTTWNIQGQILSEMNYKNGYENGSQKMYYDNGKIRSNYVIKNGKRIGLLGTKNCKNVSDSIFNK
jgi:antitoxin component YwqK of YwqJK toxin-antitoxin module